MRKRLPMSALITGLLAAPMLGGSGVAQAARQAGTPTASQMIVEAFPAEMPAEIGERMRRIARGEKLDAFGMQGLQARIARRMSDRMERVISAAQLVPAEQVVPVQMIQAQHVTADTTHKEKVPYLGVAPSQVTACGRAVELA